MIARPRTMPGKTSGSEAMLSSSQRPGSFVVKTKLPGRWLLDNIASLPLVFPGIVLGLAIMIFYLNVDIGIYGTIWIMYVSYITRFMPYGLRYNTTSMLQIHRELEESAAMCGASWTTTFRRIVLP